MKSLGLDLLLSSPGSRVNEEAPDAANDGPGVPGPVQSFLLHPGLPRGRHGASPARGCALYRENFSSPPAGRPRQDQFSSSSKDARHPRTLQASQIARGTFPWGGGRHCFRKGAGGGEGARKAYLCGAAAVSRSRAGQQAKKW